MKGMSLGRTLDLDECAQVVHDNVAVDFGLPVLLVVQIEKDFTTADPHRHGGDRAVQGIAAQAALGAQATDGVVQGHVGTRDRGRACSPVRPQYVTVDPKCGFAEGFEIKDRAQRPPEETLDFLAASVGARTPGVAFVPLASGVWKHGVLSGEPATPATAKKTGDTPLEPHGAIDLGVSEGDQRRTAGVGVDPSFEAERTKLIDSTSNASPPGGGGVA